MKPLVQTRVLACVAALIVGGAASAAIAQRAGSPPAQALEAARKAPTPMLGGHPDLTGVLSV